MKMHRMIILTAMAILPIAAGAATFIVPAAGTGAGANGSHWQTELTLHSNSTTAMNVALTFHDRNGAAATTAVTLAPRSTVAIDDIVKTRFGADNATGAVEIVVDDAFANKLAIASRTFNSSENGEFGQDIPAINVKNAAVAGQTVVLTAPANAVDNRFNAGLYAAADSTVRWDLVRADGTLVKSVTLDYAAGTQFQHNLAVESIFGETPANSDALLGLVIKGKVIAYGSAINNRTGDPTYVPGIGTASDIRVQFLGIDYNLDDKVEIPDADHDGVADSPLNIYATFPWPNSFRLIVAGSNPKFELVNPRDDMTLTSDGYMIWKPSDESVDSLQVRVTVDGVTDVITIPIKFL